jgi:hypothetical protein
MGGLSPLHFACGLHGEEGVHITRMLLDSLADASVRANEDESYLTHALVSYFYSTIKTNSSNAVRIVQLISYEL